MKILAAVLSLSFLVVVSTSDANAARRGTMTGYDNTYGSTGKCTAGTCAPKKSGKPAKKITP
jgi:hypothetical protein